MVPPVGVCETELPIALGAVRATVVRPSPDQDGLLSSVARLHGVDLDPKLLPEPSLAYTARAFRNPESRRRLLELAALETELKQLHERSRTLDPADCTDADICHILAAQT